MSFHELRIRVVIKGRKQYDCIWCPKKIRKGYIHFSRVYLLNGDFMSERLHPECRRAMKASDVYADVFEPHQQEFGEPITE